MTGEPTIKDTSMPKFGVTAWGQATVIVSDSKILNMSYNGVCASGNSSITMQVMYPTSFSFETLKTHLFGAFYASSWQLMRSISACICQVNRAPAYWGEAA